MSLSAWDDFRATGRRVARAKTASVDLPRIPIAGRSIVSARDGVVPTQRGLRVKGDLWPPVDFAVVLGLLAASRLAAETRGTVAIRSRYRPPRGEFDILLGDGQ